MSICNLISKIKELPDCIVHELDGVPRVRSGLKLPKDLVDFYTYCGGIDLFVSGSHRTYIVPPNKFIPADNVFFDEDTLEFYKSQEGYSDELSTDWYVLADIENGNYILIDLNSDRCGKCYQGLWETYAMKGESPIIAINLIELLNKLIDSKGEKWYWESDDYISLGDAYDCV